MNEERGETGIRIVFVRYGSHPLPVDIIPWLCHTAPLVGQSPLDSAQTEDGVKRTHVLSSRRAVSGLEPTGTVIVVAQVAVVECRGCVCVVRGWVALATHTAERQGEPRDDNDVNCGLKCWRTLVRLLRGHRRGICTVRGAERCREGWEMLERG